MKTHFLKLFKFYNIMRVIKTKVYTINEHPDKEKCFEWIRNNWHDLNEHSAYEIIDSIKELSKQIGGTVNYSISATPDRGEHITFNSYDEDTLMEIANSDDPYPLTGVCWDADLIEGLLNGDPERVLRMLHEDTEYMYSDEGLTELCEANEYEFDENGIQI